MATTSDKAIPTPAELTAYADVFFQILKESSSILKDASERSESQEVVNERVAQMMVALHADEASLRIVDAYLSAVEDGSPLRPMRYALLGQVLARMADEGMLDEGRQD